MIKFRAWHKELKQLFPVDCIQGLYSTKYSQLPQAIIFTPEDEFYGCSLERLELMQWSGFKDVNSKDIFDGDILKINDDDEDHVGIVRFTSGMFWVSPQTLFDDYALDYYTECPDFRITILGNIYENPELLEKT